MESLSTINSKLNSKIHNATRMMSIEVVLENRLKSGTLVPPRTHCCVLRRLLTCQITGNQVETSKGAREVKKFEKRSQPPVAVSKIRERNFRVIDTKGMVCLLENKSNRPNCISYYCLEVRCATTLN